MGDIAGYITYNMPSLPASPLGKRRLVAAALDPAQDVAIEAARAAGWSKQRLVVKALPGLTSGDLEPQAPWGTGRRLSQFRLPPETAVMLAKRCAEWKSTKAQVISACARALTSRPRAEQ